MVDMPDSTFTHHEAQLGEGHEPSDDAAGYYTLGGPLVDTKAPDGPIADRWQTRKFEARLVNPANRRKLNIIIVGTGLAGGSAAATALRYVLAQPFVAAAAIGTTRADHLRELARAASLPLPTEDVDRLRRRQRELFGA